ncbi:MAG TPA: hypothetical protein VIG05_04985 [Candidatus Nitrosotenuis sp.]
MKLFNTYCDTARVVKTKSSHTDKFADEMVDTIVSIVEKHGLLVGGGIRKISDGVYKINFMTQSKEHDTIRPSNKGAKKNRIGT